MKRIFLFILTNLAVMLVLGFVVHLLGVDKYMTQNGMQTGMLFVFALVMGFSGSIISLLMSKQMAIWSAGVHVIQNPESPAEDWLLKTVSAYAERAGIPMPDVGIYEGDPNAFATGASKSNSLVAVSTGLLDAMTREEAEAVIAHEVAHIANGDMVTMTLIQGVVNTFVIFFARIVGSIVDAAIRKGDNRGGPGIGYMLTTMVCEVIFGILASLIVSWFSRHREFRADAGAAEIMGTPKHMKNALKKLMVISGEPLPKSVAAFGISGGGMMAMFSTHPPLEDRIAALDQN